MTHHLTGSFHQQLIAKIGIKLLTYPFAPFRVKTQGVHVVSAAAACFARGLIPYERATSTNSCRSSFLPRLNLDITVPTGILNVSAISLSENSSTSASSTISRHSTAILSNA